MAFPAINALALVALLFIVASFASYRLFFHPLAKVPGPRIAAITGLWLAFKVSRGNIQRIQQHLHNEYGSVVRIAPNEVSLSSTEALRTIYTVSSGFLKGPWYRVAKAPDTIGPDADSLDFLTEEKMDRYRLQRRTLGPIYSIPGIEKHEDHVDLTVSRFVTKLKNLDSQFIDLGQWMYIFATDTLCNLTFSQDNGYIEAGHSGNNFEESHKMWRFFGLVGLFPALVVSLQNYNIFAKRYHSILTPLFALFGLKSTRPMPIFLWAGGIYQKRCEAFFKNEETKGQAPGSDLNSDLLQLHQSKPEFKLSYAQNMTFTNFGAGTDTISESLTAVLLCIGSSPHTQRRLHAEIDDAIARGSFSSPPTYQETAKLEYLHLCIKEAMRLYPALAASMTRVHPHKTVAIDGYDLPAGTIMGINPYVFNQQRSTFGDDADVFVPERWIPGSRHSAEDIKNMERNMIIWGCAPRTCPGQHLATVVMSKFLAEILAKFEIGVSVDDRAESRAYFAIQMTGIKANFREREDIKAAKA